MSNLLYRLQFPLLPRIYSQKHSEMMSDPELTVTGVLRDVKASARSSLLCTIDTYELHVARGRADLPRPQLGSEVADLASIDSS